MGSVTQDEKITWTTQGLRSQSVLSLPLNKGGISHAGIFQPCAKTLHASALHILELSAIVLSKSIVSVLAYVVRYCLDGECKDCSKD